MGMVGRGGPKKRAEEMTRELCKTNLVVGWDQAGVRTEVHAVGVQTERIQSE